MTEEQKAFISLLESMPEKDVVRMYSSYRFLAELNGLDDVWRRDACKAELSRRETARQIGTFNPMTLRRPEPS
jgi:hypothetical protein